MKNFLSGVLITVHDKSIARLIDTKFFGDLPGGKDKPSYGLSVRSINIIHGRDMLSGYYQHMDGSLRFDIPESDYLIVPIKELHRYLPGGYLTKQTIRVHGEYYSTCAKKYKERVRG